MTRMKNFKDIFFFSYFLCQNSIIKFCPYKRWLLMFIYSLLTTSFGVSVHKREYKRGWRYKWWIKCLLVMLYQIELLTNNQLDVFQMKNKKNTQYDKNTKHESSMGTYKKYTKNLIITCYAFSITYINMWCGFRLKIIWNIIKC